MKKDKLRNRVKLIGFAATLLCASFGTALGDSIVLDQSQSLYKGGLSARTLPGYVIWQSFTAGLSGTLTEIDMGFFNEMSGYGQLRIILGEGTGGMLLQSLQVPVVGVTQPEVTWNAWVVDVPVVAGQQYTFSFTPNPLTLPDPYGVALGPAFVSCDPSQERCTVDPADPLGRPVKPFDPYPRGVAGSDDPSGSYRTNTDLVFRTYVRQTPVPEPTTFLLFGLSAFIVVLYKKFNP